MARLPVITAPNPILRTKSQLVEVVDDDLRKLMDDMLETMYASLGIGLAAIQVGVAKRVIVMDLSNEEEPAAPQCFVNPKIAWTSDEMGIYNEGCLSVPEYYADVERPSKCRVKYLDYDGAKHEIKANGLLATCIQHEMDHLNVDRLSSYGLFMRARNCA